jgi:hypothetical protein
VTPVAAEAEHHHHEEIEMNYQGWREWLDAGCPTELEDDTRPVVARCGHTLDEQVPPAGCGEPIREGEEMGEFYDPRTPLDDGSHAHYLMHAQCGLDAKFEIA